MTTHDELAAHVRDILACCGIDPGQINTVATRRLKLAIDLAVSAERERVAKAAHTLYTAADPSSDVARATGYLLNVIAGRRVATDDQPAPTWDVVLAAIREGKQP